jgi:hypothetical protein
MGGRPEKLPRRSQPVIPDRRMPRNAIHALTGTSYKGEFLTFGNIFAIMAATGTRLSRGQCRTVRHSRVAIASPTYGAEPVDKTDRMSRKMPVQRHKCSGVSESWDDLPRPAPPAIAAGAEGAGVSAAQLAAARICPATSREEYAPSGAPPGRPQAAAPGRTKVPPRAMA